MADHLYLVPVVFDDLGVGRGPQYFRWRFHAGNVSADWAMMDYGFLPTGLVYARGLSLADEAFLAAQPDVYQWPDGAGLDAPITDPDLPAFFEALYVPTDWLTPSTSYRALLRMLAGLFQFAGRFGNLSGGAPLFGQPGVTLETNYRSTPTNWQAWFDATIASFGYPPPPGNPRLRSLMKQVGDAWGAKPFYMGGLTF